jgi:hypothetical protein
MATYVNDLRLKEISTGDESGTWGTSTNTNLELIGEALGYATQQVFSSDADATTTIADGASDPARAMYFKITSAGSLTATRTCTIAPNTVSRVMFIENATTGSQSIAISQGSGANVTIATGKTAVVYLDGAGATAAVVDAMSGVDPGVTDTLTEVLVAGNTSGGTNIELSTTDKVQFRDAAIYLNSSVDGQLDIVADTEIQIAATTVDLNGNLDVSGTTLVTGVLTTTAATVFNGGFASNADSTLGTDKKVQFRDAAIYINSSVDGQLDIVADTEIQIAATTVDLNGNLDVSGTTVSAGKITADAGIDIDNINIDGTTIALSSGDLTLDAAGDIILDADTGVWRFKDAGTTLYQIAVDGASVVLYTGVSDADMVFKGNDGGSTVTALTLDMSAAGAATFNSSITIPDYIYHTSDANTYFGFPGGDEFELITAAQSRMKLVGSETTFNEGGNDKDFRVESSSNANMLFVDGGNDQVIIGSSSSLNPSDAGLYARDGLIVGNFSGSGTGFTVYRGSGLNTNINHDSTKAYLTTSGIPLHFRTTLDTNFKISMETDGVVINEGGADYDFRVESNDNANALFVDGGNNSVGLFAGAADTVNANLAVGLTGVAVAGDTDGATIGKASTVKLVNSNNYGSTDAGVFLLGGGTGGGVGQISSGLGFFRENSANWGTQLRFYVHETATSDIDMLQEVARFKTNEFVINETSHDYDFRVESDTNANAIFMDASLSYVGINKSPAVELDVQQVSTSYPLRISASGGVSRSMVFADSEGSPSRVNWLAGAQYNTDNGWELTPSTANGGYTFTNRVLTAYANGNLTVNENGIDADFRVESDSNAHMLVVDASANAVIIGNNAQRTTGGFNPALTVDDTKNAAFFRNNSGGAIQGMQSGGTTGAQNFLIFYNQGNTGVGSVQISNGNSGTSVSYNTSSDVRLKENIADADDAGALIDAIQVRKFDWIENGEHQRYGMVAQELNTVAPEAVSEGETEEDMMGVDYSKLVPMLIKEIQSLRARVADLES